MRKRLLVFAAGIVAALSVAPGATATHTFCPAPATDDPGHSEFTHHIRANTPGPEGHRPGSHRGMSGCHPEESRP
jgi:hypothetical protein